MPVFDGTSSFILIARIQVKAEKIDEYLELAVATEDAVRDSEPGMRHYTFPEFGDIRRFMIWPGAVGFLATTGYGIRKANFAPYCARLLLGAASGLRSR